jgi:hypothetical protein
MVHIQYRETLESNLDYEHPVLLYLECTMSTTKFEVDLYQ